MAAKAKAKKAKKLPRGTKEERTAYAKSLIIANPNYGKARVNELVKGKYKVGLRRIDVARLKEETLVGRTKKQTGMVSVKRLIAEMLPPEDITKEQVIKIGFDEAYMKLRASGFITSEIRHIFSSESPIAVFNSKPFAAQLRTRRRWYRDMRKDGWTKGQIVTAINQYYSPEKEGSPFDFLKVEYLPPLKIDFDPGEERKRKIAAKKVKALGGHYR